MSNIQSKNLINRAGPLSIFVAGLLLTVFGIQTIVELGSVELGSVHRFLVETAPIGRLGSLLAVILLLIISLSKGPVEPHSRNRILASPYVVLALLFFSIWISLLPTVASWATVDSVARPIGGLIPISDSQDYYRGVERLLQTGELDEVSQRRPLNATLFSSRLLLGNNNFQNALLIQAILFGISLFFVTYIIYRRYGGLASVLIFSLNFSFAAHYLPTTLSESLGITLGLLALAFFLLSFERKYKYLFHVGIFSLVLAMLARTGTVFVIPLIILYAGKFLSLNGKYNYRQVFVAGAIALLAVGFNYSLNAFYGDGSPGMQGNSHYNLYKLAVGGDSWKQIYFDYPEMKEVSPGELASFSLKKSLEAIVTSPNIIVAEYSKLLFSGSIGFLKGLFHSYMYSSYSLNISDTIQNLFNTSSEYAEKLKHSLIAVIASSILVFLAFGLFRVLLHLRQTALFHLLLISVLGTLLSIPFLYNIASVRVFAVIIPFLSLLPMMAALAIRRSSILLDTPSSSALSGSGSVLKYMKYFLALILIMALVLPYFSYKVYSQELKEDSYSGVQCLNHERKFVMRFGPGSAHLNIVADASVDRSFVPTIRKSDFSISPMHKSRTHWVNLKEGTTLLAGYDLLSRQFSYISFESDILGKEDNYKVFCARLIESEGKDLWQVTDSKNL